MAKSKVKIDVIGAKELIKAISRSRDFVDREIDIGNRKSAETVLQFAKSKVRKVSGRLANSLKVFGSEKGNKNNVYQIGADSNDFKDLGFAYGHMIESGYTDKRTGKKIPAHPYLRPAMNKNKKNSENNVKNAINSALQKVGL